MLVRDLSKIECQGLLVRLGFGRLACARQEQPYIVPIYFAYEPDHLFGFATTGQKIEWMRSNPLVCVEADEVVREDSWSSVLIRGRYEELPDTPQYAELRVHARSLLERRSLWWRSAMASSQTRLTVRQPIPVFFCIHIEEMTGHRATPDP
jgi:uncharacterized protein